VPGVTAIKVGGHFEGSMVLHWDGHLFIADTFVNVPVSFHLSFRGSPSSRCSGIAKDRILTTM
jgi:glyoxylase-like metal-dependent hydrolase (beta-lactamase superfamily II)